MLNFYQSEIKMNKNRIRNVTTDTSLVNCNSITTNNFKSEQFLKYQVNWKTNQIILKKYTFYFIL